MLTNLHVRNLALIDEAEVAFGPGLNILTGETGAGKSILIGSINLALGHKISMDQLREGADSALVELVFHVDDEELIRYLREQGIEPEDSQVIISRRIRNGRSVNRINDVTVTVSRIRQVTGRLLDIHGQHEHQSLLYPEQQLRYLDKYGKDTIGPLLEEVAGAYATWAELKRKISSFKMDDHEREREMSFLEYEIREIDEAALREGEEEELERRYRLMVNSRKITEALGRAYEFTAGRDGAGETMGRAIQELRSVVGYDIGLQNSADMLADAEAILSDFNREMAEYLSNLEFSEEAFREVEERLDLIHRMQSKYGNTTYEIMAYQEKQLFRLDALRNYEEEKNRLTESCAAAESILAEACERLSKARREAADAFAGALRGELEDLNFLQAAFEIRLEQTEGFSRTGRDSALFMISTNPGEPLRPLEKVVSGGELSRIMLAIKTLLADRDETGTLIFDEIDTGISGRTAQKVSEKLFRISRAHQVICITHLAQIAAMADRHFEIEKTIEEGMTISRISLLDEEGEIGALSRILGGARITAAVRENAREMKRQAQSRRNAAI